ncbi:hypothetical protein [Streptomyces sp. 4N124]|uniref:hypothetical protein n=1 Tax=Streptomyces sp. 4N124 TaxID=3457420 RepID=UPI003FD33164
MTPDELAARRADMAAELDEQEARVLGLAVAGAQGAFDLLNRIRRSRERLLGTGPALQVEVLVPQGATPEEKRQAVIAAVAERLKAEEERDD